MVLDQMRVVEAHLKGHDEIGNVSDRDVIFVAQGDNDIDDILPFGINYRLNEFADVCEESGFEKRRTCRGWKELTLEGLLTFARYVFQLHLERRDFAEVIAVDVNMNNIDHVRYTPKIICSKATLIIIAHFAKKCKFLVAKMGWDLTKKYAIIEVEY
ncbi:hypothetical protein IJF85_02045 [Candidatus Saccharibacteria bacterium]|nr:hypothetical protein [Candidatus Saccharibacteria bacterium]